jgi:hypothetical protein
MQPGFFMAPQVPQGGSYKLVPVFYNFNRYKQSTSSLMIDRNTNIGRRDFPTS